MIIITAAVFKLAACLN